LIRRSSRNASYHPIQTRSLTLSVPLLRKNLGHSPFPCRSRARWRTPVDHAAGLLAMHCLVRGQSPSDYMIMVPAPQESLGDLEEKAEKLLQAGHKVKSAVRLTRREQEVLDGILRSLANKEIASELNLSERTVKFHASSLLAKFKVRGPHGTHAGNLAQSHAAFARGRQSTRAARCHLLPVAESLCQAHAFPANVFALARPRLMA